MSPATPSARRPTFHMEPAHPSVIKMEEDLVALYRVIRERHQDAIDKGFDQVSRQIGFVVTTTMPVNLNVSKQGTKAALAAENLRGTLFEQTFTPMLSEIGNAMTGRMGEGTYPVYLFWYEALRLKLRTDWMEPAHLHLHWMEPAHPGQLTTAEAIPEALRPGIREPAHWFRPDIPLELPEALVISAIDQVYPELNLVDRIQAARQLPAATAAALRPGIREPAHFRQVLEGIDRETLDRLIQVLTAFQQSL